MYCLSPNIDLLFTEAGPSHADRVRAAAAAGFTAVEMWGPSGKDLPALRDALQETGLTLTSQLAEPRMQFMVDPDHAPFFEGLEQGVEAARLLGTPRLVVGSGVGFPGAKRQGQLDKLIDIFTQGVAHIAGSGVSLVLEPVNTRVDHPGALLDRTAEAVYIARGVGSPDFGILYDLYHSITEGEDVAAELAAAGDTVHYVQLADAPGRAEPGTGEVDWGLRLRQLRDSGYDGPIGLEYYPSVDSAESTRGIAAIAATA
ncbi:hydroxypyruvate isomerase [Kocuria flava]|uniref:Hydroxypyruvate isomerase n=1 Tax=Kocuria flava TaxID=446860 RepID=A0A2N4T0F8_9MICC|nr:TIM barrel protein [Kocuria flava]PLC11700.1 hydroxypyruvate isomerase [Kocuria flava]